MRLLLSLCFPARVCVRHIEITRAFLHEDYKGPTPLVMVPLANFDGTPIHAGMVAKVRKNLWGTPHAPHVYTEGLMDHLNGAGYNSLISDPHLYLRIN